MAVTNEDVRLRDVVRELKQGPPRILLVGSAISAPPPSSLPMVGQALSDILQSLVESCEARGVIFGRQRSPIIGLNTRVKFELFFAVLADYFGSSPTRSLVASVYGQRRPNRNHRALALLSQEHQVVTTNFDENIEECHVGVRVVHLHGSATNPDSLVITLGQLSSRDRPELASFRAALQSNPRLVCVGYSGWGDVDIFPSIQQLAVRPDAEIVWFEFHAAKPPVKARLCCHDLFSTENALTLWAGIESPPIVKGYTVHGPNFKALARELADAYPVNTILRALASVAHEGRFGPLGLKLYELARRTGGPRAVSNYEWGIAYERANDRRRAARHLLKAAEEVGGDERTSHYAGAAFCYQLIGQIEKSRRIYDQARSTLEIKPDTQYSFLDNVLRGRAGLYLNLASQIPTVAKRRQFLIGAGINKDLDVLTSAPDPLGQRPGRMDLLLRIEQLKLDVLLERPQAELVERTGNLWTIAKGFQDLEIEARLARLASAIDKQLGRRLLSAAGRDILRSGGSRRDLRKVLVAWVATFVPLMRGR